MPKISNLEAKIAILDLTRPILEAKMAQGIFHEAFLAGTVEWRRPLAKPESSEYSRSIEQSHTPVILSRMRRI